MAAARSPDSDAVAGRRGRIQAAAPAAVAIIATHSKIMTTPAVGSNAALGTGTVAPASQHLYGGATVSAAPLEAPTELSRIFDACQSATP